MRVLVCGGRTYRDWATVCRVLDGLTRAPDWIIHGGAKGADALASQWAHSRDVAQERYDADWEKHGRAAGPIRNQQMIVEGKPHLVVAFPGGKGTADMVRRAKAAFIEVLEVK